MNNKGALSLLTDFIKFHESLLKYEKFLFNVLNEMEGDVELKFDDDEDDEDDKLSLDINKNEIVPYTLWGIKTLKDECVRKGVDLNQIKDVVDKKKLIDLLLKLEFDVKDLLYSYPGVIIKETMKTRLCNAFEMYNIETISDLMLKKKDGNIYRMRNLGRKSFQVINEVLKNFYEKFRNGEL